MVPQLSQPIIDFIIAVTEKLLIKLNIGSCTVTYVGRDDHGKVREEEERDWEQ